MPFLSAVLRWIGRIISALLTGAISLVFLALALGRTDLPPMERAILAFVSVTGAVVALVFLIKGPIRPTGRFSPYRTMFWTKDEG